MNKPNKGIELKLNESLKKIVKVKMRTILSSRRFKNKFKVVKRKVKGLAYHVAKNRKESWRSTSDSLLIRQTDQLLRESTRLTKALINRRKSLSCQTSYLRLRETETK